MMTDRFPSNGRPSGRHRTTSGALVTQQQAAVLAGCSRDTIARARRAGRFPHARLVDGRWMIPADDLDEAGFSPRHRTADVPSGDDDNQLTDGGEAAGGSVLLARAEARIAALEDLVARQDAELWFLRRLTVDTMAKRAS